MSVATARQDICDTLAEALAGTTWYPKRPTVLKAETGYVVLTGITSENSTYGELQAGFNALLILGSNEPAAADRIDDLIMPFHEAFRGWAYGLTVSPAEVTVGDNVLYTLVATFQMTVSTEMEAS